MKNTFVGPVNSMATRAISVQAHRGLRYALRLVTVLAALGFGSSLCQAANVPAPAGMGNYCSITWPGGGWSFASDTNGGDPCLWILRQSAPGGTIQRKGLYANNNVNRVVYRCFPPNYGWVGIYEGWGNAPLTWAYDAAKGKRGHARARKRAPYQAMTPTISASCGAGRCAGLSRARRGCPDSNPDSNGQLLPLTCTVLACGPLSPSSSAKRTFVPTCSFSNFASRTLFWWK